MADNIPFNHTNLTANCVNYESYQDYYAVQAMLSFLYSLVFIIAVTGNVLVIYVVATNKEMQSVTNIFITNLAIADLLVNFTSLWLTPCYIFLGHWIWGSVLCHAVPLFQGMSTFISALTLTAIAVDRYIVILYPFRQRMSLRVCLITVIGIWLIGSILVAPLAAHMELRFYEACGEYVCREEWDAYPEMRVVYGFVVLSLQFGIPFVVIIFCYIRIWIRVSNRKSMINETRSSISSTSEEQRRKHLLKMMVCMVVIFGLCWLPVNTLNVLRDAASIDKEEYFVILFLIAHLCSMSATCWNPILYAWMNDNFRREFQAVLPCFKDIGRLTQSGSFVKGARYVDECEGDSMKRKSPREVSPFSIHRSNGSTTKPGSIGQTTSCNGRSCLAHWKKHGKCESEDCDGGNVRLALLGEHDPESKQEEKETMNGIVEKSCNGNVNHA